MSTKLTKFTSVLLSATTAMFVAGSALMPVAHAQTDLQSQINALLAQIAQLQSQLASQGGPVSSGACNFSRSLTVGMKGDDVTCLQNYLSAGGFLKVAATGYFGSLTKAAAAAWQAANGVSPAAGYFGSLSRAKYSSLAGSGTPTPTPTPTPGTGSGLTVRLASDQPAAGLFGESFSSRPFTKLVLTASSDGDVTVKALTVERTGQGNDAAFSGVAALDESGVRMGGSKTFGSDHRLRLTDTFVVKAGQSRTVTLAGDSDADQNDYNGQLVALSLVGVETNGAAVNASFPMSGATHTVNSTLAIGTVTLAIGSFDPGSGQTKEIGTNGFIFAGLRVSAGSAEDMLVKSVRWNQSGSAGSSDLKNVKVVFDGVTYDTTLSDDGKYYVAKFADGIKILKGFNKEMYIKGDIVDGSARTVDFDLYRYADLQVVGLTYGYGAEPSATNGADTDGDDGEFQATEPRFDSFQHHIGAGSIQVTVSNTVPAQNVSINLADQPLGAFDAIVKGEQVSVAQIIFRFGRWNGSSAANDTQDITGVKLVDANGKVVAGPADITASSPNLTFSDTVTFPVGTNTYTLKGKLSTDFASDDTVAASTTPSSNWSSVRGVTSGVSITPTPSSALAANTMTVKAGALRVSTQPTPVAQTIVSGLRQFTFAQFSFDATASGEDVRLNSAQVEYNFGQANSADDLTLCQLWDGSTALNTGGNAVNPSNSDSSGDDKSFTFDQSWILPKGTVKTLDLKCDTVSTTTSTNASTYNFTLEIPGDADDMVPTGSTSGQTVTETYNDTTGQAITLSNSGALSVALDSTSPSLKLASAGATDVTLAAYRFTATNEAVQVKQLAIVLGGTSSNTPQDLSKITFWDGSTKVGEAILSSDNATATLTGFVVPKDSDKILMVKGDLANIGVGLAGKPGHRVRVEYDGAAADSAGDATRGTGLSSGSTIYSTGSVTSSNGVHVFKAVPTVARIAIPSTKLINSTMPLYRFSVSAPSSGQGVGLYKFTFNIATSTSGVTTFAITTVQVRGYSDSGFSNAAYDNGGLLNSTTEGVTLIVGDTGRHEIYFDPTTVDGVNAAIQVPAGTTRYFELVGTVANMSATSSTVTVSLEGDAAYIKGTNLDMANSTDGDTFSGSNPAYAFATTAANVDIANETNDDFIWSDNATTTSGIATYDWVNGYRVNGLPDTNLTAEVLTP